MTDLINPQLVRSYKSYLADLMNHIDNVSTYTQETEFAEERLLQLKDSDIYEWLAVKAYGTPNPTDTDKPTLCRSNTLQYAKKAVSYFMPNKNIQWSVASQTGNPTKSTKVNMLIKAVKKKEVQKEGRQCQARRPLELEEFQKLLKLLHERKNETHCSIVAAMVKFQFHMIGRLDDAAHFSMRELKVHNQFDFALQGRLCWSKNDREERDAPEQIIFAANDASFCVHLALANHLEHFLSSGDGDTSEYVFNMGGNPTRTKDRAYTVLKEIFESEDFVRDMVDGKLGTHSIHKLSSTYARRNGCGEDDIDMRSRWKKSKKQVDTNVDVQLPYPDAKVAATLSIGGLIKYVVRDGSNVTDDFILQYVTPLTRCKLGNQVAHILGRALLWGSFDDEVSKQLNPILVQRIKNAYNRICTLNVGINPIKKIPLVVSGFEGTLYVDEVFVEGCNNRDEENTINIEDSQRRKNRDQSQMLALYSQIASLNRQAIEIKAELKCLRSTQNENITKMYSMIRRIHMFPVSRRRNEEVSNIEDNVKRSVRAPQVMPTLAKCPKTLDLLWQEYEFGLNGQKPAKEFTSRERGHNRFTYHRRKIFWDKVSEMIRAGHDSHTAIDLIYQAYNNVSVTKIINLMRKDKNTGGHPLLRV